MSRSNIMVTFFFAALAFLFNSFSIAVEPSIATQVTLASVNGGEIEAITQRGYILQGLTSGLSYFFFALAVVYCVFNLYKSMKNKNTLTAALLLIATLFFTGCGPLNVDQFADINHNESAFVIPVEGDIKQQEKFETVKDLEGYKVSIKRILIPKRKHSVGRMPWDYEWIPMVKVITVSRSPITLILDPSEVTGAGGAKSKDNGIWVESSDSVGFSTGFSITAHISEEDAALFLYRYKGNSLELTMNTEVRARIQSTCTDFASKVNMDQLRSVKHEMIAKIREEVVPFFKESGITITTIGSFGGFTYENKKIQDAIDLVFVAQQEKQTAAAMLAAQKDKNERMKQEGEGEASKVMEAAKGKAQAVRTEAEAQAEAIKMVALATKEAGQDPLFVQLKTLEVISEQVKRWNGTYPSYYLNMTNGAGDSNKSPLLMLQLPSPSAKAAGPERQ